MSYALFAQVWSVVVLVLWVALLSIAVRRASFRDRNGVHRMETVATHARYFEGPIVSFGLAMALITAVAATLIGTDDYARFVAIAIAFARGFLLPLGIGLLAWYWRERSTWLRGRAE